MRTVVDHWLEIGRALVPFECRNMSGFWLVSHFALSPLRAASVVHRAKDARDLEHCGVKEAEAGVRFVRSPHATVARIAAAACTARDFRRFAVVAQLPASLSTRLWGTAWHRRCRAFDKARGLSAAPSVSTCSRGQGRAHWFTACLPLSCLGDESAMMEVLSRLLFDAVQRIMPSQNRHSSPDRTPFTLRVRVQRIFGTAVPPAIDEECLADEVIEGAGSFGVADVVTFTDRPGTTGALAWSLRRHGLRLHLLQTRAMATGEHFRFQFFEAERYLLAYVTHLRRSGQGFPGLPPGFPSRAGGAGPAAVLRL